MTARDVYAPDVAWLREERVPDPVAGPLDGLPELAVEIRSPSTRANVLSMKKARYEAAGQAELWLVDTRARSVLVFRRSGSEASRFDAELEVTDTDPLTSPLLPGFELPVARLFERS